MDDGPALLVVQTAVDGSVPGCNDVSPTMTTPVALDLTAYPASFVRAALSVDVVRFANVVPAKTSVASQSLCASP